MTRTFVVAALVALAVPGLAAAAPAQAKRIDEKVRELRKEQIKALQEQLDDQWGRLKIGRDQVVTFVSAVFNLGEAELEVAETKEAEQAALEGMVKRFKDAEGDVDQLRMAGLATRGQVAELRAARLKAEIQLEKWKKR